MINKLTFASEILLSEAHAFYVQSDSLMGMYFDFGGDIGPGLAPSAIKLEYYA